ncbi:MAG: CHASE2 domain-containing protein [Bacteroidota bacterium]
MGRFGIQKSNLRPWLVKVGLGVGVAFLVVFLTQDIVFRGALLKRLELSSIDFRFRARGSIEIPKDSLKVVIVDISHESAQGIPPPYNRRPWPRSLFGHLIRNLNRAGARAIGIDLLMSTPDQFDPKFDNELMQVIRQSGNVVVAGEVKQRYLKEIGEQTIEIQIRREKENFKNIFFEADSSIGIVNLMGDDDSIFRRYRPFAYHPGQGVRVPTFAFACLNKYFDLPPFQAAKITPGYFTLADRNIPQYDDVSMLINFYGPDHTFPHYEFLNVIDDAEFETVVEQELGVDLNVFDDPDVGGLLQSGIFKDKIVLVGSVEPEDKDLFPVAFAKGRAEGDRMMFGVEIHANAIQTILDQNYITRQSNANEVALIFVFTFLTFYSTSALKGLKIKRGFLLEAAAFFIVALLIAGIIGLAIWLFKHNFLMAVVSPVLSIAFGYVGSTVYHYLAERKQKAMIKGMFSTYVNPTVVDELIAHPEKLRLGGERKELTVLFSDIAGFTTFSESLPPDELVAFLNEYLSAMTELIFNYRGTLDKYEGDAIMAFWGAPIHQENHALLCCQTATEMQKGLVQLREKWAAERKPHVEVRIGINTGEMVVGNMGGIGRFDYTVIGDSVNLGSRLEGANKQYHTFIMISERTHELVKEHAITRELDLLVVKGRTRAIKVYELLGLVRHSIPAEKIELLEWYRKGLQHHRRREWKKAIQCLEKALLIDPNDYPSKIYIERSKMYELNPPPDDWDGVFVLKMK